MAATVLCAANVGRLKEAHLFSRHGCCGIVRSKHGKTKRDLLVKQTWLLRYSTVHSKRENTKRGSLVQKTWLLRH